MDIEHHRTNLKMTYPPVRGAQVNFAAAQPERHIA
jgi:hypothetical protein